MKKLGTIISILGLSTTMTEAGDVSSGHAIFTDYCQVCHGISANGEGPMSPIMLVQPTDLTRLTFSNNGEFPLERVVMRIDGRDPLVSHGSNMPIYGFLFDEIDEATVSLHTSSGQPILTSQPVADLVEWLYTIQITD